MRDDLVLIGSYAEGTTGLAAVRCDQPDVALVDLGLPDMEGVDVIRTISASPTPTRPLVLSGSDDQTLVYLALEAGAVGYLTKELQGEEVCNAVIAAARGETVLSRRLQAALAKGIRQHAAAPSELTPREAEVLRLTAQGCSAPEIGRLLHISTATVKTHLAGLYEKLGVSDRAAAVAQAMKYGLVDIDADPTPEPSRRRAEVEARPG